MNKKNTLYITLVIIWGLLSLSSIIGFIFKIKEVYANGNPSFFLIFLLVFNICFILYFWLSGTKDIIYVAFYYIQKSKFKKREKEILNTKLPSDFSNKKVLLVYCTCNDFNEDSLEQSMKQDYHNFETYILDDSTNLEYMQRIDNFAKEHQIKVIRREDRTGFKAGNLNNFLDSQSEIDYDYFVVLDSDEIIPNDFIKKALHYFAYDKNVGILQATHVSTRNRTKFMERFHPGVNSHWPTYQTIKETYGFLSFLGHGAMISKKCYEAVGGFPRLVAEDICFTLEAKFNGFKTAFSNEIICQEEYPIDYYAFKKRHLKWTGGNLEFIQHYTKKIFTSKQLHWYEKLDVVLFTYSLPLSSVFFIFLVMNLMLMPALGYSAAYPIWLMVPTTIYLLSPMLNDIIYLHDKMPFHKYIQYLISSFFLYGSLYWLSLYGATKVWMGIKPKFIVTPKEEQAYTFAEIIKGNIQEILFSIFLIITSIYFTQSLLPVILIVIPSLSSIYLTKMYKPITPKN